MSRRLIRIQRPQIATKPDSPQMAHGASRAPGSFSAPPLLLPEHAGQGSQVHGSLRSSFRVFTGFLPGGGGLPPADAYAANRRSPPSMNSLLRSPTMKRRPSSVQAWAVVKLPPKKSATTSPGSVVSSTANLGRDSGNRAGCGLMPASRHLRRYGVLDAECEAIRRLCGMAPPLSLLNAPSLTT